MPAAPHLLLLNGAPGSGKSTLAASVAGRRPMGLALDIDVIKHELVGWADDPHTAGLYARHLALGQARSHLRDGRDVVIGQYLGRVDFILQLESLAASEGARFVEVILHLEPDDLRARISARRAAPDRPEHRVNNPLVGPDDAPAFAAAIEQVRALRPWAVVIDAKPPIEAVVTDITALLDNRSHNR